MSPKATTPPAEPQEPTSQDAASDEQPQDLQPDAQPQEQAPNPVDQTPGDDQPQDPPATATYGVIATYPIDLPDGRPGVPGTHVELSEADAAPLLADGHIVRI